MTKKATSSTNIKPYILDTFRGGISSETDKGTEGSFKNAYQLNNQDIDDVLQCSSTMVTVDMTTITDLIQFFVPAADGSTYAFGDTGKIYSIAGSVYDPVVTLQFSGTNGKIKGAAQFQDSSNNNYLLWATDTSLARKLLPGDDAWGDVSENFKTLLNSAEWHTMKMAAGQINIANANFLATYDYNANWNVAALNLTPGNLIKCLEEQDDQIIMGSTRSDTAEEGYIWSWVIQALNYVQKKKIPAKGVNALISSEILFNQAGPNGEIFYTDFVNALPINNAVGGGQVNPGGVTVLSDIAHFGFFGGTKPGIWTFGRRRYTHPLALNFQYRLARDIAGSTISTIGALSTMSGLLLASWGTTDGSTSQYGVDMLSNTTMAAAIYEGLEFDAGTPELKKKAGDVKAVLTPLPSGNTSISIKYRLDKQTSWQYAVFNDGTTTYAVANQTEAIASIGATGVIVEIGAELNPDTTTNPNTTPQIQNITTSIEEQSEYA